MNIWIDLDNSPHVPFFAPIIRELEQRGHSITLTARDAFQVCELANLFGLNYRQVGRHYGKHRVLKAYGTCVRTLQLFPTTLGAKPDLALSHGSRSQLLTASIRGIPSLVIFDYEFARHLVFFGPTWVMVPSVIPDSATRQAPSRILKYPGIKEDVYAPGFRPDPSIKTQLGLDGRSLVVTVRPPASEAHYHNPKSDELFEAVIDFIGRTPDAKIILVPRNGKQEISVRRAWPDLFSAGKIIVPEHAVDGLNLIWHSDLVISGGGTMNREAAALGVPVYSIFRGRIGAVDRYLSDTGRLVLLHSVEDVHTKLMLSRRPYQCGPPLGRGETLQVIVDNIVGICGDAMPRNAALRSWLRNSGRNRSREKQLCAAISPSRNGQEPVSAALVLTDYYRCIPQSAQFHPPDRPTDLPSYFGLGPEIIGYGRLAPENQTWKPDCGMEDTLSRVKIEGQAVRIPFDAAEVVENLRRERYAASFREEGRIFNEIIRKAYYVLRPLLPVPARKHMQKARLRDWQKLKFPSWPVDCTVERIHQRLLALSMKAQGLQEIPFIWFWPEGFSSCAIMTHDVESLAGRDSCASVMDLDESFGFRSAFQVVPEKRYPVPKSLLEAIEGRGFEVNIHDLNHDGRLYADHKEFLRRVQHINRYAREYGAQGFRSGALYRNADWYDSLEFSYDMSLPNVAHLDAQRGGCCTVMPYFIGKIIELPLTCTQDYTLFHILNDYTIDLWVKQISLIRESYGLISFIVHPDYVMTQRARNVYRALLGYLAKLKSGGNLWCALPRDVADWWRERSKLELVQEEGQWAIKGAGKERARIAYACLDGTEITYKLPR